MVYNSRWIININKKELANILGVKESGLKTIINRGQLESRLKDKGYKLISKTKQGRKVIYNIEDTGIKIPNINKGYINYKQFKIEYSLKDNIGIYYIIKDNDIYIGSTTSSFRDRFRSHLCGNCKSMKHTYDMLQNGGDFKILYDMTNIIDDKLIRITEGEFIEYFKNYTNYNVINRIDLKPLSKCSDTNKSTTRYIKIKNDKYEQAIKLLIDNGLLEINKI